MKLDRLNLFGPGNPINFSLPEDVSVQPDYFPATVFPLLGKNSRDKGMEFHCLLRECEKVEILSFPRLLVGRQGRLNCIMS